LIDDGLDDDDDGDGDELAFDDDETIAFRVLIVSCWADFRGDRTRPDSSPEIGDDDCDLFA